MDLAVLFVVLPPKPPGTCTEAKEQQHQADALVTASTSVAASSNATAHQAAQLQDKVGV